jgi:tetratricopeptide (TPR) repeat protein
MATATTENPTGFALSSNTRQITITAVAVVGVIAAASYFMSSKDSKSEAARSALFIAQKSVETETKALTPAPAAPAKVDAKAAKDAKTPAVPVEDVSFKRLDVDAKYPESIKKLNGVITDFSGTRAAFDARMQLGELYFNHGEATKALPVFQAAVDSAPNSLEKALALSATAAAQENQSMFKEARETYEKAINLGEASVKGDLLLGSARTSLALKDTAKAKQTYEQILNQLPNTEYSRYAEALKAQLD